MEILENDKSPETVQNEAPQEILEDNLAPVKESKKEKLFSKLRTISQKWTINYKKILFISLISGAAIVGISAIAFQPEKTSLLSLAPDEVILLERQKLIEESIEKEISHALEKMFGKDNYHVGVVAYLSLVKEKEKSITHKPQVVTLNSQSYDSNEQFINPVYQQLLAKELSGNINQAPQQTTQAQAQEPIDIQGTEFNPIEAMLNEDSAPLDEFSDFGNDITLPGFENMDAESISVLEPFQSQTQTQQRNYIGDIPTQNPSLIVNQKSNQNRIIIDKTISIKEQPKLKFDRLFVSVVVNKTLTDKFNIKHKDLANFLAAMGGIDKERNDQFELSLVPFREHVVDMRDSGIQIRKTITGIPLWLYISLIVTAIITYFSITPIKLFLKAKKEKKEILIKDNAIKQQQELQQKIQEEKDWNEKRSKIIDIASKNPEEMASILLDWIEQTEESNSSDESKPAEQEEKKDSKKEEKQKK